MSEDENVCCPDLDIIDCADTDEHRHLMCSYSSALLENGTVKQYCLENFKGCVLRKEDGGR